MKRIIVLCLVFFFCATVHSRRGGWHGRLHDATAMRQVVAVVEEQLEEPLRSILLYTPPMDSTVVTQGYFILQMALQADTFHKNPCDALRIAYENTWQHMHTFHYPYDALPPPERPAPQLNSCGPLSDATLKRLRLARKVFNL